MRSELSRTTAELARKSEELKKLAGEAAHRAVEIIRSGEPPAAPATPMGESSESVGSMPDEKEPDEEQ
jgi:hypothetical protein